MYIGHDLPALVGTELRRVRRHFACSHGHDVKDPPGRKLHEPVRDIGWRRRNFAGNWPIAFALLAVANHAVGLEQGLAFVNRLRRCAVRICQFPSSTRSFFFSRAIMKYLITTRDGSSNGLLERETIPRYGVRCVSFVSGTTGHVRHVFHRSMLRAGAAAQKHKNHHEWSSMKKQLFHSSTSSSLIRSAPLSCSTRVAQCTSNPGSRLRSTSANWSLVTPSAKSDSFFPGYSRARRKSAATVASPDRSTVISKQMGTKARLELSGLPPTLSGQSRTVV